MPNAVADTTLALEIEATPTPTPMQEAHRPRTTHRAKPAEVGATDLDAIALYRDDEVKAAWALVHQAEADRDEALRIARDAIAILRNRAIAIGTEVTGERMRLRWNSHTYDYAFARSVFGDEAIPPAPLGRLAPDATKREPGWRDPLAALAMEDE